MPKPHGKDRRLQVEDPHNIRETFVNLPEAGISFNQFDQIFHITLCVERPQAHENITQRIVVSRLALTRGAAQALCDGLQRILKGSALSASTGPVQ